MAPGQLPSLDQLRRDAKALKKAFATGDATARQRVASEIRDHDPESLKHADFLHVIARESGFASWPRLTFAAESQGLDVAARRQRLAAALYNGQDWMTRAILEETPDITRGQIGLSCALLDRVEVERLIAEDPARATQLDGFRRPMLHLAFSRHIHAAPDRRDDMLAIAEMLLAQGAGANDSMPVSPDNDHQLSALYGAIGHADNMVLGQWLLEHGADPNDGESLYHATELGHHDGLRLLLEHGADPKGTNALLRAMDFHDHDAVQMLLDHGARADDFDGTHVGGEAPWVVPALHQAARRGSDARMIAMLLDAGADPNRVYEGASAYGYARAFGHAELARQIEARGAATPLSPEETLLAGAADGEVPEGQWIDPAKLPEAYRNIIRMILHLPGRLDHVKRLVSLGLEYDRPDSEGLTPVQLAGWEGLPEVMAYFIRLGPDMAHVNGYGGTLLSTIIHGSENCPNREEREHIECLRLALEHGVALPRRQIDLAGREDISAYLADWARAKPGQVV